MRIKIWDWLTIKFLEVAEKCSSSSLRKTLEISLKVGLLLFYLTLPWPRKVDNFSWTKLFTALGTLPRLLHAGSTSGKGKISSKKQNSLSTPDVVTVFDILLETIHTFSWNRQRLVLSIFNFPLQDRSTLRTAVQYLENIHSSSTSIYLDSS